MPHANRLAPNAARLIANALDAQGRTLHDLAQSIEMPYPTIRRSIRGSRPLTTNELEAITVELGLDLLDLVAEATRGDAA